MLNVVNASPETLTGEISEVLHGVVVTDPYRWLEDRSSPRTREWLVVQTEYARSYLDGISNRDLIRERVKRYLDVETYDSLWKSRNRYFFRKRHRNEEQASIYVRDGLNGEDQLLIDPAKYKSGKYTSVKPLLVSPDGRLLLYEVKYGGERMGAFELFDIETRTTLQDRLPRGYLRSFAFANDSRSFYYVHVTANAERPHRQAVYRHILDTKFPEDKEIFFAGEDPRLRLHIVRGATQLGFLVRKFDDKTHTDFYLWTPGNNFTQVVIKDAEYSVAPVLLGNGRILAATDQDAPNFRIVEIRRQGDQIQDFINLIPEQECRIQKWIVTRDRIVVSYIRDLRTEIHIFDLDGNLLSRVCNDEWHTSRLASGSTDDEAFFIERESFLHPVEICRVSSQDADPKSWARRSIAIESRNYSQVRVWFNSTDGTRVPMFLAGRSDVLERGSHPVVMTAYGGFGVSMTPQFSVLVAVLMELGCIFALPNIRGGSEFGVEWHNSAKRRNRQVAFDDFLSAAEWLIKTKRAAPSKLAAFGGSNSGLLIGAAVTQRPDVFRAVLCIAPLLDMIRYHLFDNADFWKEEFGTSESPEDFEALLGYSPYHRVSDGTAYPAVMLVAGDADQKCNALHARKMIARLQQANISDHRIILAYSAFHGHSPVLPLSERIESLTDRLAFLCDQLELTIP